MAVLELTGISKQFGSLKANDDINLSLEQGEILALLGENGAGKTTLMNILFGHYAADSGYVTVNGKRLPPHSTEAALKNGIGMVHQHFTLADNMTVTENVLLGTESLWSPWSKKRSARKRIVALAKSLNLKLDPDSLVADLSVGQRQRVEILKAMYRDVRILILDEPTAVLTPQEVDSLFQILTDMAADGLSIIIISHKLNEILEISHRVAVLRDGKKIGEVLTSEVDRFELAEMIVGRAIHRPIRNPLEIGECVVELTALTYSDPVSRRRILNEITLKLYAHRIVGLAGVSGNGQSELALVLSGLAQHSSGAIRFNGKDIVSTETAMLSRCGAARIPEDRHAEGVVGEMSVWENLLLEDLGALPCWKFGGHIIDRREARSRAAQMIEGFDIRCASMNMPASLLSGGNMQKLILARNLQNSPAFVLANQPVRGLDEGAIAFVHETLLRCRSNGSAILLISEDLDEILRLSDEVVVMHDGTLSAPLDASNVTARELGVLMTGGSLATHQAPEPNAN